MPMEKDKLFVVKKYVKAKSASDALRKEVGVKASEVWIDEEWQKGNKENLANAIGFSVPRTKEDL